LPGNTSLVKIDEAQKRLIEAGFNPEHELMEIEATNGFELPRIRIEHSTTGKHRLYIDSGENYLSDSSQEEDIKGNGFTAVVFAEQFIRALWNENETVPICSAIDNKPIAQDPVSLSCLNCRESVIHEGHCKPKMRLWLLLQKDGQIRPHVMNLSPTSLKHWTNHKRKLRRSKLPVVAMNTIFKLEDIKKNSYRWAEVVFDVDGIASKEMLLAAKEARDQLNRIMAEITAKDFEDPGDKSEN
jgi:hypothetical protein